MIVSVCVVAYNEEKVLGKLLEDIQAQDYDHEKMEILLIDSMSTDHTRDIMEKFRETEKSFLKISVFSNEKKRCDKSFKKRRERGKNEIFFASLYRDVPNESYQFLIPFAQRISGPDRMDRNRSIGKKQSFFDKQTSRVVPPPAPPRTL